MKLLLPVLTSVALAYATDKFYSPVADVTCVEDGDSGMDCHPGQDDDAQILEIDVVDSEIERRQISCNINLPWVSACYISCSTQNCARAWCDKGVCRCSECY